MPRLTKAEFEFLTARKPSMLAQVSTPEPVKPQRESELHKQIQKECHRRLLPMLHGAMHRRTHRTAGEPDFAIIVPPYGRVMFVEAKAKGGKLSEDQLRFHKAAKEAGNQVYTVTTLDEFKLELQGIIDEGSVFADTQLRLQNAMEMIRAMRVEAALGIIRQLTPKPALPKSDIKFQDNAMQEEIDGLKAVLDVLRERVEVQENEIAEHNAKVLSLIMECAKWRHLAEEKIALRRELEAALGIETGDTNDKALEKALKTIRELQKAAKQQQP